MLSQIFQAPPDVDEVFVQFFAKPDKTYRRPEIRGVQGNTLLPLKDVVERAPQLAKDAVDAGQHLYYRPALRTKRGRVLGTWALWADVDLRSTPDAAQRIEAFKPAPSYIAFTGGGYHLVWMLREFCEDLKVIEAKQYGLAAALGGDFSAAGVKMGLRLPETVNWKYYALDKPATQYYCRLIFPAPEQMQDPARYFPDEFPDGSKPRAKKEEVVGPASYRDLFLKYFQGQVEDPSREEWLVNCVFHEDTKPSLCINVEKGIYFCQAESCMRKGTALDFYRRMENITWTAAKKALEHLSSKASMVHLLEEHLRALCVPVYRDGSQIMLVHRKKNGRIGRFLPFSTGRRSDIRSTLATLFDGSPATQVEEAIGDAVPLKTMNEMLEEAILQLGQGLPHKEDVRLLGQGIHHEGDQTFLVDGSRLNRWDSGLKEWRVVKEPVYQGRWVTYLTEDDPSSWYPTGVVVKPVDPRMVLDAYEYILANNWFFSNPDDPLLLALYSLYLPNWTLFGTPIHLQISGESQSGKSSLSEGWFAGRTDNSVCMVPGMRYYTNTTAAYLYQGHDNATVPIVLDEILDHDDFRARDLVELIRNMESGGSPVRRGSQDGRRTRVYNAMFPTVWSSIKVPDTMQDVNRRLHVHMPRIEPAPTPPWTSIWDRWTPDDLRKLARLGAELVVQNAAAIQGVYRDLRNDLRALGGGHRMAHRLLPLLAIAKFCGREIEGLLQRVVERVRVVEAQSFEASPAEIIRQEILFKPIRLPQFEGEVTMAQALERAQDGKDFNAVNDGLYLWRSGRYAGEIGVVTGRFHSSHLGLSRQSTQNIGRMLKNIPGWKSNEPRRIGGVVLRAHIFDAQTLMGGNLMKETVE